MNFIHIYFRGRHGIIRRVIEKSTGKEFAGKFLMLSDPKEKEFFQTELESLRVLDHPHIMKIHEAYETVKSYVLITELYPLSVVSIKTFDNDS